MIALKNAVIGTLGDFAPTIVDDNCSTNVETGVIVICYQIAVSSTTHGMMCLTELMNTFVFQTASKHLTPALVGDIEAAANVTSPTNLIVTNNVALARRYTLTACIAGSPAAIKVRRSMNIPL